MNERYLFRGKQTDGRLWVEGHYYTRNQKPYILKVDRNGEYPYKIDPSTLGQCTGLRDKNGALIFEGDVVRKEGTNFTVKYRSETAGFAAYNQDNEPCSIYDLMNLTLDGREETDKVENNIEVIGNVHNKEFASNA